MYNDYMNLQRFLLAILILLPTIFFKIWRLRISGTRSTCVSSNTVKIANGILLIFFPKFL